LTERGITGGDALKALVFLTISATVTVQGLTAAWVARWLGLDQGSSTVILGDHPLVEPLAELLRSLNQVVEVLPLPSAACWRQPAGQTEPNGHKVGSALGDEVGRLLAGSLQEVVLSESALLKADIDHAETLLILTRDPQMNWAIAELMVKLSVSAAIWTVLLPEMPILEGIRTLPISFAQLQRWAGYLEAKRAELRSITLPTLADLGLKPSPSAVASAQESSSAARLALLNPLSAQIGLEDPGAPAAGRELVAKGSPVIPGRPAILPAQARHVAARGLHLLPRAPGQPCRGRGSLCKRSGFAPSRVSAPVCWGCQTPLRSLGTSGQPAATGDEGAPLHLLGPAQVNPGRGATFQLHPLPLVQPRVVFQLVQAGQQAQGNAIALAVEPISARDRHGVRAEIVEVDVVEAVCSQKLRPLQQAVVLAAPPQGAVDKNHRRLFHLALGGH
jgi:hypothetical protein